MQALVDNKNRVPGLHYPCSSHPNPAIPCYIYFFFFGALQIRSSSTTATTTYMKS